MCAAPLYTYFHRRTLCRSPCWIHNCEHFTCQVKISVVNFKQRRNPKELTEIWKGAKRTKAWSDFSQYRAGTDPCKAATEISNLVNRKKSCESSCATIWYGSVQKSWRPQSNVSIGIASVEGLSLGIPDFQPNPFYSIVDALFDIPFAPPFLVHFAVGKCSTIFETHPSGLNPLRLRANHHVHNKTVILNLWENQLLWNRQPVFPLANSPCKIHPKRHGLKSRLWRMWRPESATWLKPTQAEGVVERYLEQRILRHLWNESMMVSSSPNCS